jgi:hypothetical protein
MARELPEIPATGDEIRGGTPSWRIQQGSRNTNREKHEISRMDQDVENAVALHGPQGRGLQ